MYVQPILAEKQSAAILLKACWAVRAPCKRSLSTAELHIHETTLASNLLATTWSHSTSSAQYSSLMSSGSELANKAKDVLRDCSRYVVFDEVGTVLATNYQPSLPELQVLTRVLDDRENAIRNGLVIDGQRYEVHRFHPPLAYGRTMGCAPESSIGAALCKIDQGITGQPCYGVITYPMPNLSARMVPILQQFCDQQLKASRLQQAQSADIPRTQTAGLSTLHSET